MNVEHLHRILSEYRPDMKLTILVNGATLMEADVSAVITTLMSQPPDASVSFFERSECIIRERGEFTDDVAGAPPYRQWLEIDMR